MPPAPSPPLPPFASSPPVNCPDRRPAQKGDELPIILALRRSRLLRIAKSSGQSPSIRPSPASSALPFALPPPSGPSGAAPFSALEGRRDYVDHSRSRRARSTTSLLPAALPTLAAPPAVRAHVTGDAMLATPGSRSRGRWDSAGRLRRTHLMPCSSGATARWRKRWGPTVDLTRSIRRLRHLHDAGRAERDRSICAGRPATGRRPSDAGVLGEGGRGALAQPCAVPAGPPRSSRDPA